MPHFRFRAVSPRIVQSLSKKLTDDFQEPMQSPREDFTFESIHTTFYTEGEPAPMYPFVEVLWFDRGQIIQDQVAVTITERIREAMSDPELDVAVVFTALQPDQYYDNGNHY
jgi:phenylpyruvate tautomerase PptA (4-oxalocrotonate tautomerase family)